jgi:phosphomevalonate kinase
MGTASGQSTTFHDFGVPLANAHKTGLGSSAALVTALTAALFRFYAPDRFAGLLDDERGRAQLHNLAQVVHSAAQGKVGSGFDVAAAIYGSCLYRRFSPAIINDLPKPGSPGFVRGLRRLVDNGPREESRWDYEIVKDAAKMPRSLRLVLCDVDCGTATVGMVKAVLAWRDRCMSENMVIWQELHHQNKRLGELLVSLAELESETPHGFDEALSSVLGGDSDWTQAAPIRQKFSEVAETLLSIRRLVRKMSSEAGVPIEPAPQTDLLDACSALPGVLGGVVPGAGGYDAIALLVVDKQQVLERLSSLCSNWKSAAGSAAGATGGRVHMLGVREEIDGVRVENEALYGRLLY